MSFPFVSTTAGVSTGAKKQIKPTTNNGEATVGQNNKAARQRRCKNAANKPKIQILGEWVLGDWLLGEWLLEGSILMENAILGDRLLRDWQKENAIPGGRPWELPGSASAPGGIALGARNPQDRFLRDWVLGD